MVHLYYGEGKGKTTAAIGLSVRALGNDWRVIFVQFLKNAPAGEVGVLEKLGVTLLRGKASTHFFSEMTDQEKAETRTISDGLFAQAVSLCCSPAPTLLVFDEICAAFQYRLLDPAPVESFLSSVPAAVEVVLTGRNPPELFLRHADYVTEFCKQKHPYDCGIRARKGVEW